MGRGLEDTLRSVVETSSPVVVAVVAREPEEHPSLGFLVDLTAKPSGKFLQARLLFLGTRPDGGSFDPVSVGDEVLVLFPATDSVPDPNKAIAIAGLNSAKVPLPDVFDNTTPERIHPNGYNFRTASGDSIASVTRVDFLDDLGTWLTAFDAFLSGCSTATTAPQVAGFAATMSTALTTAFGSPNGFTAKVKNVANAGAAYRSTAVKTS